MNSSYGIKFVEPIPTLSSSWGQGLIRVKYVQYREIQKMRENPWEYQVGYMVGQPKRRPHVPNNSTPTT